MSARPPPQKKTTYHGAAIEMPQYFFRTAISVYCLHLGLCPYLTDRVSCCRSHVAQRLSPRIEARPESIASVMSPILFPPLGFGTPGQGVTKAPWRRIPTIVLLVVVSCSTTAGPPLPDCVLHSIRAACPKQLRRRWISLACCVKQSKSCRSWEWLLVVPRLDIRPSMRVSDAEA